MMAIKEKRFLFILLIASIALLTISAITPAIYSKSKNIYEKIQVLNQIITIVNENYVEPVNWDEVMDGAFYGLLERLDPHSAYISKERIEDISERFHGKFEGIGIEFDLLGGYITVISPIAGSPSELAGLQPGDQIIEIEGESAYKITKDQVFKKLRGPKGTTVNITVRRVGLEEPLHYQITRDEIPIYSVTGAFMLDEKTGYIRLSRFASTSSKEVEEALQKLINNGMTRLIFDLRTNSGGYLEQAAEISDKFITTRDTLVYTAGRIQDSHQIYLSNPDRGYGDFALIVLINRWSASASEIVAGAIQDLDRGLIIGETSFGKGLVQRQWMLKDNSALRVTIGRYYTPGGRLIQRPYSDGAHKYYTELIDENRETRLDSVIKDRPKYKTRGGRIVYGGGGITPDVYLTLEKVNASTNRIVGHPERLTFNWGTEFASYHKDEWSSLSEFKGEFEISDDLFFEFISYVKEKNLKINEEEIQKDQDYVKTILKAQIAGALWGKEAYYEILILSDNQIKEGFYHFDEARKFIANNQYE